MKQTKQSKLFLLDGTGKAEGKGKGKRVRSTGGGSRTVSVRLLRLDHGGLLRCWKKIPAKFWTACSRKKKDI